MDPRRVARVLRAVLGGDFDFEAPSRRVSYGAALFLAGVGTGVFLGVLFAPTSGGELRSEIGERTREGFERARTGVHAKAQEFTTSHKGPAGQASAASPAERSNVS